MSMYSMPSTMYTLGLLTLRDGSYYSSVSILQREKRRLRLGICSESHFK